MNRALRIFRTLLTLLLVAHFSGVAQAAIITASATTVAATQTAVDSAVSGDTVVVPAGTATWTGTVTVPNTKGIFIDGTGVILTKGATDNPLFAINTHATVRTEIFGFTMTDNRINSNQTISVDGSAFTNAKFRMHHMTFISNAATTFLWTFKAWGLVDHCTFTAESSAEMIHNMAWGSGITTGWTEDITPGSPDALYVEDCTFSKTTQNDQYYWGTAAIQSYYGSRTVFRYNVCNYVHLDQHGTGGNVGARWYEIYENTFNLPNPGYNGIGGNQSNFIALRAGSGVAFNNKIRGGTNQGTGGNTADEEDTGPYPELYQIGRGKNQASDPLYCWGNDMTFAIANATLIQEGRDIFVNTAKPGYTPYTYPHPLQGSVNAAANPRRQSLLLGTPN